MLGVVSSATALALAALTAVGLTDLARHQVDEGLWILALVIGSRVACSRLVAEWDDGTSQRLRATWRSELITYLALPPTAKDRSRSDLARAIDQVAASPAFTRLGVSATCSLLGLVIVFWSAGWLPLVIVLGLLALSGPLYQRAGRRTAVTSEEHRERRTLLENRQLEILEHAPELRALGASEYGANEIGSISQSEHVLALRTVRVALGSSLVTEFLSGVSVGLVAMVCGFSLLDGRLTLLRALLAVLVTSELFLQVRRYGVEFHRRDDATQAKELLSTLRVPRRPADPSTLLSATGLVTEANAGVVTLHLNRGDRLLVTGPSGVGKSTLLHTLLGWRSALRGSVERTDAVIGFVSAESTLFSGTLRDNLAQSVSLADEDLRVCLDSLGLRGPRFTDLDVHLLADGRGMSSGERIRVVIARALLAAPELLVLDDIAGVLDLEARAVVAETLSALEGLTIVEATVDTPVVSDATLVIALQ